jgi:hypothetical protein
LILLDDSGSSQTKGDENVEKEKQSFHVTKIWNIKTQRGTKIQSFLEKSTSLRAKTNTIPLHPCFSVL